MSCTRTVSENEKKAQRNTHNRESIIDKRIRARRESTARTHRDGWRRRAREAHKGAFGGTASRVVGERDYLSQFFFLLVSIAFFFSSLFLFGGDEKKTH